MGTFEGRDGSCGLLRFVGFGSTGCILPKELRWFLIYLYRSRRSRPRVSIDNSSLSSEMTVKEQLEERKARLRVPDRDGSSREDTSAGTTDFSASENSSSKFCFFFLHDFV